MNRRIALWIALLALVVRALALWDDHDALLFAVGGHDAPEYLEMARGFAQGTWPDAKPFFWAPGYGFFLGVLAKVDASMTWLKSAQVVLGAASSVLVALLAWRLFERVRVAWTAGLMAALYGPLVYYDLQISPASLDVFLSLALVLLLLEAERRDRVWLWGAAGVALAASTVTRGTAILLLPFVALALLLARRASLPLRARLLRIAVLALPVCLVLGAVARHNLEGDRAWGRTSRRASATATATAEAAKPRLIVLSYNLGINLVLGNVVKRYAINRVEHPQSLLDYKMLIYEPVLHGASRPSEQSRYLEQQALDWVRAHPVQWLSLLGTKAFELLHGEEISRDSSIEASRLDNHVLALLLWKLGIAFPSGLVIPLALLGIVLARKRSAAHALVLTAIAVQALFVLAFFVTTRYRLALCTMALPYAAYALHAGFAALRAMPRARRVAVASFALAAVAVSNYGLTPMPREHLAFEHAILASRLELAGKSEQAIEQWRLVLARDPRYALARFQLANYEAKRGDVGAALEHYQAGLTHAPHAYAGRIGYADLLLRQGRTHDATQQMRRLLADRSAPGVRGAVCMMALRAKIELQPECGRTRR